MNTLYAHTNADFPHGPSRWQPLEKHLRNVAEKVVEFTIAFSSRNDNDGNTAGEAQSMTRMQKKGIEHDGS